MGDITKNSKVIKVFLAAFVNQTNAQNLSCRALAKYMDKSKFEVYTLAINHGNLPRLKVAGVRVFNCIFPVKISGVLGFIWGFAKADVVYLPRGLFMRWQKVLVRIFSVKSFKTVRNVIDDQALESAMSQLTNTRDQPLKNEFNFVDRVYAMTNYMSHYNRERWGIVSQPDTLLPPTDFELFASTQRVRTALKRLVFIGNDWRRKGLEDFLLLSKAFPELDFHVIGRGDKNQFQKLYGENVHFHGLLTEERLVEQIEKADLHILPSRSEGLPRVWLETLSNGLPSILYKGYGAEDFVKTGLTGFVAENVDEVKGILLSLIQGEVSLESLSTACIDDAEHYHPQKLTAAYESVIDSLHAS